jgi:multiple sugar transport system substrate-binding protein
MFLRSLLAALAFLPLALPAAAPSPRGRTLVTYWEKWNGAEREGMQALVDDFNASQEKIFVEMTAVSALDQKTLIATAGGNPPDIAGLWDVNIVPYAEKNALTPLDGLIAKAGIKEKDYIPVFWKLCVYGGHSWALPSTPATTGLIWNKDLFAKAGLDPERPPRTFAELDAYSKKLTRFGKDGHITQMGFLPAEPGWWNFGWGEFFGGRLWDGGARITADDPGNAAGFAWVQSYAKFYGVGALQTFASNALGNFASAQNPFMAGQLAMEMQGVWMGNFISLYAPGMKWGAAPFPVVKEGDDPVTFAGSDVLCIPRGAKHVDEAFAFIAYVNRQGPMEKLCVAHQKNSPLRAVSAGFYQRHKNPYIRMFQKLGYSRHAASLPRISIGTEYVNELKNAFDRIWLLQATPAQAMGEVQARIQASWDLELAKRQALAKSPPSAWLAYTPLALCLGLIALLAGAILWRQRGQRNAQGRLKYSALQGYAFAAPWLLGLALFTLYPVAASFFYSFCDYSVLSGPRFIGLENFKGLMADEVFWLALKNTALYFVFALPLGLLMALVVAVLLNANLGANGVYRTLFFLPAITPLVANFMIWMWIFHAQYGVLNYALGFLSGGRIAPIPWLADPDWSMISLILMSFWGIGYSMVIFLAALQDVPVSLYEAAELDGCSWWRKVWHISMPMISPVIYFNFIMGAIGALQVFAAPFIMTQGGPARSTYFYTQFLYENAFLYLRMGYACALAWILFLLILALTALATRGSKSAVHYVGE